MYWKFCAIEALGKVVVEGSIALLGNVVFDCAKTGGIQAAEAAATTKTSLFIESSSDSLPTIGASQFRPRAAKTDCGFAYKRYPI
ncbi:hypothetical protein LMG24238_02653 [Paraburkholderia sediminicola]|uniref:Uncharacterized protein n=1 Tax=Paraburkholderia sediminicola TaxID=458836 RepID=A0A6J5AX39_9BURK|nr:hypothetical protein [Paraburkholderia sediminicola]CAB3682408.1 hypothetical protein LMG24238_02653 [Paraburkholderia sediminicola]